MNVDLAQLLRDRDLSQAELARRLHVNKTTVLHWVEKGVPAKRVKDVERETGIPRAQLRPDLAEIFGGDQ